MPAEPNAISFARISLPELDDLLSVASAERLRRCRCHTELLLSTRAAPKAMMADAVKMPGLRPSKASMPRMIPAAPAKKIAERLPPPNCPIEDLVVPGGKIIRAYSDNMVPPWI